MTSSSSHNGWHRLGLSAALFGASCSVVNPHVRIGPLPTPKAATSTRAASYQRFRPERLSSSVEINWGPRLFSPGVESQSSLVLANGLTVHHPIDLRDAVLQDSRVDRAITAHDEARASATFWSTAGYLGVTLGMIPLIIGGAGLAAKAISEPTESTTSKTRDIAFVIGGGILLLSGVVSIVYGVVRTDDAAKARAEAFAGFDQALLDRLRLCTKPEKKGDKPEPVACP